MPGLSRNPRFLDDRCKWARAQVARGEGQVREKRARKAALRRVSQGHYRNSTPERRAAQSQLRPVPRSVVGNRSKREQDPGERETGCRGKADRKLHEVHPRSAKQGGPVAHERYLLQLSRRA